MSQIDSKALWEENRELRERLARLERELFHAQASERKLRWLVEQLPAVLWTTDRELRITSAYGTALAEVNLEPSQILGLTVSDFFCAPAPEHVGEQNSGPAPTSAAERALHGESSNYEFTWQGRAFYAHQAPLRDSAGEIAGGIGVALDVTERKQAEEEAIRRAQQLEGLGSLAGGVAHDFNNLLTGIMGNASLALEALSPNNPSRATLEDVIRSSQKAADLTSQLLAYSGRGRLQDLTGTGTVLLVDDEEMVVRFAKSALEQWGYTVLAATNGQEAVNLFRQNAAGIAIVLLDLTMPVMSGEETLRQIQSIRRDVPVILSSGYNEDEALRQLAGTGLAGFIQKPYTGAQLAKKIKAVLGARRTKASGA